MTPEQQALSFGFTSTILYLGWSSSYARMEDQWHMAGAMFFYACANVCLMWPLIKRFL